MALDIDVIQWNSMKTYHDTIAAQNGLTDGTCTVISTKKAIPLKFRTAKNYSLIKSNMHDVAAIAFDR
jgi:hypothetical protein